MRNKQNIFSIIENSFSSFRESLISGKENPRNYFDSSYLNQIRTETLQICAICDKLNADDQFVQTANELITPKQSNSLLLKAEHFFISDLIKVYQKNLIYDSPKSRFTLAYYYDVIRNKHFADEKALQSLNRLSETEEFRAHLQKIISNSAINSAEKHEYFLTSILMHVKNSQLKEAAFKIEQFLDLAFDKKAKTESKFTSINPLESKADNSQISIFPQDDTLEKVLGELNSLVGLQTVKNDVSELINLLEIQKRRSTEGLKNIDVTLHTVFLGPPGTGKTSVARLLSRIFKHLGFLSQGQLYETDREGLIAGYVGQTALKVNTAVNESLGGVLFIDEAYALTQNSFGNDYGNEAVNTLLKRMEDHRDDLAVIVAGYTEPMNLFIESNPGLRSRFNRFFHFEHFTPSELFSIFENFCKKSDFVTSSSAKEKLIDTFELLYDKKDDGFGNARVVRNLFEKCVQNQANRIVKIKKLSPKILKTFAQEDIPEPMQTVKNLFMTVKNTES